MLSSTGCRREGAPPPDTLVIPVRIAADDFGTFHLYTEVFLDEIDSCEDRKERVTLAAARTADMTYLTEGFGRHLVRQGKWLALERRGFSDD